MLTVFYFFYDPPNAAGTGLLSVTQVLVSSEVAGEGPPARRHPQQQQQQTGIDGECLLSALIALHLEDLTVAVNERGREARAAGTGRRNPTCATCAVEEQRRVVDESEETAVRLQPGLLKTFMHNWM